MKKKGLKIIIIVGTVVLIAGIILASIFIFGKKDNGSENNNPEENITIIDKPLVEVTKEDFLSTKVTIEMDEMPIADFHSKYIQPQYPNISITSSDEKNNIVRGSRNSIKEMLENEEMVALNALINNPIFGFIDTKENNFNTFYMQYAYGTGINNSENIYAIPEYINLPSIIYNTIFTEIMDLTVPDKWSDLAILKGELMDIADYSNHLVAGYDKEHFDIVKNFVMQGWNEEDAKYIIQSWEKNNILKGYDQTNIYELEGDMPIIFIMPNHEILASLGEMAYSYGVSGMLRDDNEILYINTKDGKHGEYLSIVKGDNIYEDIASWICIKESIEATYSESLTIKPYLEENLTTQQTNEYNLMMLKLLDIYEKMYDKEKIVFYE